MKKKSAVNQKYSEEMLIFLARQLRDKPAGEARRSFEHEFGISLNPNQLAGIRNSHGGSKEAFINRYASKRLPKKAGAETPEREKVTTKPAAPKPAAQSLPPLPPEKPQQRKIAADTKPAAPPKGPAFWKNRPALTDSQKEIVADVFANGEGCRQAVETLAREPEGRTDYSAQELALYLASEGVAADILNSAGYRGPQAARIAQHMRESWKGDTES